MTIDVIGSTLIDVIFNLPKKYLEKGDEPTIELPFGSKISTQDYFIGIGGSGANVAVGIQKLGIKTRLHTPLGKDVLTKYLLGVLENDKGLEVEPYLIDAETPISAILKMGGERTIVTGHPISRKDFNPTRNLGNVIHLGPVSHQADELYVDLMEHLKEGNKFFSMNPSLVVIKEKPKVFMDLLKNVDLIVLNEEEGGELTGEEDVLKIGEKIRKLGPTFVCLTCGPDGAYLFTPYGKWHSKATTPQDEVIDATGAGDALCSGFIAGFLSSCLTEPNRAKCLQKALKWGMANSGSAVASVGAQTGLLSKNIINSAALEAKLTVPR